MIEWTEQAVGQLEQAGDYIALTNSASVADRIVRRILLSVEHLAAFPAAGRVGRIRGTRELVIPNTPFLAAYAIDRDRVVILAVYHSAQRWPETF